MAIATFMTLYKYFSFPFQFHFCFPMFINGPVMNSLSLSWCWNFATFLTDVYDVDTITGTGSVSVSWRTRSQILQQQLRSVRVEISSVCPTGITTGDTRVFSVLQGEGNSVTARELGNEAWRKASIWIGWPHRSTYLMNVIFFSHTTAVSLVPYRVNVRALICNTTVEVYNGTVVIQGGNLRHNAYINEQFN